jgi:long-chain acyl-CoA synthetase
MGFENMCACLRRHAQMTPDGTALYCGDGSLSFAELDRTSGLLAHWLLDQGLRPGDRVAVHSTNSIALVQLLFALFKAGLIAVTVNVRLKPPEIRYILDHSGARFLFSEAALAPLAEAAGGLCPIFSVLPQLGDGEPALLPSVNPDEPALIIYTSGTTARPKGVTHSHRSIFHKAVVGTAITRHVPEPFWLNSLPMMHVAAFWITMMCIYNGTPVVLLPRFEPGDYLDALERFGCNVNVTLPSLLLMALEEQSRRPRRLSGLAAMFAGGDAVSLALQERCQELLGVPLLEVYGMSEVCPILGNPEHAPRAGSFGMPLGEIETRIVDDDGRDVAPGETGEILVRGPNSFLGYWDDPDATRLALRDGWVQTGDLGSRDGDGYHWFRGRKKEIIIRAGSNISPQEVEEALCPHPAVLEVGVIGAPHAVTQERVVAFIVLRDGHTATPEELRQFASRQLADYKLPEEFHFLNQLPKNPVGKVQRRALREMLIPPVLSANPNQGL